MQTDTIKVLLADDGEMSRDGLRHILETDPLVNVVGEATIAQEVVRQTRDLKPDVLILDLQWFGDDSAGTSAIREIRDHHLETRIIAITAHPRLIGEARRAGADAALHKDFGRKQLLDLIRELSRRETPFPTAETTEAAASLLTPRELEVIGLIAQGEEDKQIAVLLGIADATAKNHVQSVLAKLGARNRTHAATLARERRLIP